MTRVMDVRIRTRMGTVRIEGDVRTVRAVSFVNGGMSDAHLRASGETAKCAREITEYLEGRRRRFSVRTQPEGTPFQKEVWRALERIGYGGRCSYTDIARAIGRPAAARAVGGAIGANPVCLLIPCHRVIASDGGVGGYAWGTRRKRRLLAHEAKALGK